MDAMTMVAEMERMFGKGQPLAPSLVVTTAPVCAVRRAPAELGRCCAAAEQGRCCAAAVLVSCVCVASWTCPTHGALCIGSHD